MTGPTPLHRFLDILPRGLRRQRLLKLFVRLGWVEPVQRMTFNAGAQAWVDLRDADSRAAYLARSFWPEIHPLASAFLRSGGAFFDVGANLGLVSFGLLPLVSDPAVEFHLFEANPRIVPLLQRSARLWPGRRIFVNHACVTDQAGTSRLELPGEEWSHGFMGEGAGDIGNLILDDYIESRGVERIAFFKIDIEGFELRALRGARRAIERGRIDNAFVELAPEALARAGSSVADLLAMLDASGFDYYFCRLWDQPEPMQLDWHHAEVHGTRLAFARARPLPAAFHHGDVLAVHRSSELSTQIREALPGSTLSPSP